MAPAISPVQLSTRVPPQCDVAIIGGGIVGLSAALVLAERGVSVTLLEKGTIAGEQSSRNLGWVRKTIRGRDDLPLMIEAERMWAAMPGRVGTDVGYRQSGIMYVARTDQEMAEYSAWLDSVRDFQLDSRMVGPDKIAALVPGSSGAWKGGVYAPSDGRAEPSLASSAIAGAAIANGATIVENCAVRSLVMEGGRVGGVLTEQGEIRCRQVILAGGLWSRRLLGNHGVKLPTLPAIASVFRTTPMDGPGEIAVGASNFSFRKGITGGYTITQRAALNVPLLPDSLLIGHQYLGLIRKQWRNMRLSLGRPFFNDLALPRQWSAMQESPFEKVRTMDPKVNDALIKEAFENVANAWPMFRHAKIEEAWAGAIDMTPDGLPVISEVAALPGLVLASGLSGHGFATGPAAGQLAADLVTGQRPLVDPTPYAFTRLAR